VLKEEKTLLESQIKIINEDKPSDDSEDEFTEAPDEQYRLEHCNNEIERLTNLVNILTDINKKFSELKV
jgi:hypothetical protein